MLKSAHSQSNVILTELKTLEWDILNPARIIILENKKEGRASNI